MARLQHQELRSAIRSSLRFGDAARALALLSSPGPFGSKRSDNAGLVLCVALLLDEGG
jgi:hypothetical protein